MGDLDAILVRASQFDRQRSRAAELGIATSLTAVDVADIFLELDRLSADLAAADAALTSVTDLLDELRTKVTRLAEIAEGTADAFALEHGFAARQCERLARAMVVGLRGALAREDVPQPLTDAQLEASDWHRDDAAQTRRADR